MMDPLLLLPRCMYREWEEGLLCSLRVYLFSRWRFMHASLSLRGTSSRSTVLVYLRTDSCNFSLSSSSEGMGGWRARWVLVLRLSLWQKVTVLGRTIEGWDGEVSSCCVWFRALGRSSCLCVLVLRMVEVGWRKRVVSDEGSLRLGEALWGDLLLDFCFLVRCSELMVD